MPQPGPRFPDPDDEYEVFQVACLIGEHTDVIEAQE